MDSVFICTAKQTARFLARRTGMLDLRGMLMTFVISTTCHVGWPVFCEDSCFAIL